MEEALLGLSDYDKNGAKYILHFDLFYSEDELSKINKIELFYQLIQIASKQSLKR